MHATLLKASRFIIYFFKTLGIGVVSVAIRKCIGVRRISKGLEDIILGSWFI
jgi:hypothetical protein